MTTAQHKKRIAIANLAQGGGDGKTWTSQLMITICKLLDIELLVLDADQGNRALSLLEPDAQAIDIMEEPKVLLGDVLQSLPNGEAVVLDLGANTFADSVNFLNFLFQLGFELQDRGYSVHALWIVSTNKVGAAEGLKPIARQYESAYSPTWVFNDRDASGTMPEGFQAEVTAQRRMIERTQDRFGLWPEKLVADTAYGSAPNLAWLVEEQGIEPHIPVFDKSARRDDTFERSAFTFDHDDDSYICPGGNRLRPSNRNFSTPRPRGNADGFIRYRAREKDCGACGLKERCTPKMAARKIMRSVHEGARDLARDIATSDAYLVSRRQRKKVEMLFAHLKRILKLDRLRLRGPNGAKDEFHLAAAAQNLRKLAKMRRNPGLAPA